MSVTVASYTTSLAPQASTSAKGGKENAPLRQTTLLSALDKGLQKGKKRTITLVNGGEKCFEEENAFGIVNDALLDELDLASALPVTAQVRFPRMVWQIMSADSDIRLSRFWRR